MDDEERGTQTQRLEMPCIWLKSAFLESEMFGFGVKLLQGYIIHHQLPATGNPLIDNSHHVPDGEQSEDFGEL